MSGELFTVQPADAPRYWDIFDPLLHRFCAETQSTTPGVIRCKVESGDAQLWGYAVDGYVRGCAVTQVYEHSGGRYVNVWVAVGDLDDVIDDAISRIEGWAREIGCTAVEIVGRKGWGRRLEGYRQRAVIFEKDLRGLH